MHPTKPSRARRVRLLVPSALAVVILSGAAAPAGAVESDRGAALSRRAAAGPVDDLINGILESIKALLPPGISLPDIKIPEIKLPEIKLPEIKLPEIPGVQLPQIPGVEIPGLPSLTPPALPDPADPADPVEIVPELPDVEVPGIPDLP
ncbi:hypothetical protein OHB39_07685 [Streptomyces sp. NBC_00047]|uniref:hypothetical protein n=1 Tax=Streptomyces sp. NBC_00047 TaxID=2975627 RepID=UPI00224E6BF0|nr:hypothetical protein [Streptomyces sp. NBC_00047]MCX5607460.1 hypothetical protein [Streptomyces sp. NBC_00047]